MDRDDDGFLRSAEIERLLEALMTARGERGFTEDDAVRVLEWAEATRIAASALDLVLSGRFLIDLTADRKPKFRPAASRST